jgi:RND family efflux transporter MFP subunit
MGRAILFSVAIILSSCSGPYSSQPVAAKESQAALPVTTITASRSSIPEVVTANGELFAEEQAQLSTKVPGRVTRLAVDLGSVVRQGDLIAELEKRDYEFRLEQAAALVEQTRARLGIQHQDGDEVKAEETAIVREAAAALKEARFIMETTGRLASEGVVSRIDFEKAQVRAQGVEARYQAALEEVMQLRSQLAERRAQLALARQQLSDATIVAPFDGAVTRRIASIGEFLPVNAPLVTLVRQSPLRVRLEVPEREASRIARGQRIELQLEGSGAVHPGRVVRLSPAIEAQNRSLIVEGEIPNEDRALRPGSFVRGVITVNSAARGFAVPRSALVAFAGIERVFVVKDGKLEDRVTVTGRRLDNDLVEIVDGLAEGDLVVTNANDRMSRGQPVRVI